MKETCIIVLDPIEACLSDLKKNCAFLPLVPIFLLVCQNFHSRAKIKAEDVENRTVLLEGQANKQAFLNYLNYIDASISMLSYFTYCE